MIREFIIFGTISSIFLTTAEENENRWKLVFNEEFNGNSLNKDLWEIQTGCSEAYGAGNKQCYLDGNNNLQVSNGILTIIAKIENVEDKNFTSGRIHTFGTGYLYGYYLIRAKLPYGKLLWPALWLITRPIEPPCYHEIDMMEAQGQDPDRLLFTAHYGLNFKNLTKNGSKNRTKLGLDEDFHNYGILWTEKSLGWYIDNKLYYEVSLDRETWKTEGKLQCEALPFSQPMNITLNMGVGGNLFTDNELTPEEAMKNWKKPTFEIDWIRIFQTDSMIRKHPEYKEKKLQEEFLSFSRFREQFLNSIR